MSQLSNLALVWTVAALAAVDVAWKPRAGSTIERTFEVTTELRSEQFEILIDGKALADDGYAFTSVSKRKVHVSDELVGIAAGRPTKLVRHFETLERVDEEVTSSDGESDTEEIEYASDLEGKRVSFEWDPKGETWKHAYAGDDTGDDALLEKLVEDLDLRAFLPSAEQELGASWDVPAAALGVLVMPGGDVALRRKDGDSYGARFDRQCEEAARTGLKGELRAKLTEIREIESTRCAVIELEGRIRTQVEFETEDAWKANLELELDPRGELVWDLTAHRAHALTLKAEIKTSVKTVDPDSEAGENSTFEKLVGTTRLEARFKTP